LHFIEVKTLAGTNYVRPDMVVAVQTTATGTSIIAMVGGAQVQSSENAKALADKIAQALAAPESKD